MKVTEVKLSGSYLTCEVVNDMGIVLKTFRHLALIGAEQFILGEARAWLDGYIAGLRDSEKGGDQ